VPPRNYAATTTAPTRRRWGSGANSPAMRRKDELLASARRRALSVKEKYAGDGAVIKRTVYVASGGLAAAAVTEYIGAEVMGQDARFVVGGALVAGAIVGPIKGELKEALVGVGSGILACALEDVAAEWF